jgi:2,3-bisphosphoglycerate-independent phosphoglycerate mutase
MKYVVIQGDGMADEPLADLGGKTPLEVARTDTLDHMAGRGILGLTRTIPRGLPPGSAVGTMSVLGYDPVLHYTGRTAIEAVAMGVELRADDVALACNLVTLETSAVGVEVMRDFAGGHPSTAEARELVLDLGRALGREGLEFHPGLGYRHLLVWRGGESRVRTTPPHDLSGKPLVGAFPEGPGSGLLRELMERARAVLAEHPICRARRERDEGAPNAIWLWGQGKRPTLPHFADRFGVEGAVVAGVDIANGLGLLAGLRRITVPGATGALDTDFRGKAEAGLRALEERDFLFVHVEAPAECGCMGDAQRKIEAIARLDAEVVAPLLDGLRARGGDWRVLVMPDHATPCALRTHTAEPVPFVVYVSTDETKPRSLARGFNERDARDQGIFIPEAHTLLERLLRH